MKVIVKDIKTNSFIPFRNIKEITESKEFFTGDTMLNFVGRLNTKHTINIKDQEVIISDLNESTEEDFNESKRMKHLFIKARKFNQDIQYSGTENEKQEKLYEHLKELGIPADHPAVKLLNFDILEDLRYYTPNDSKVRGIRIISESFMTKLDNLLMEIYLGGQEI